MKFGLIGHPLGHSLSPKVHRLLLNLDNDNSTYELFDIAPENLLSEVPKLLESLDGFNVTVPHKLAVMPYLDKFTETAESYGAVNTVITKTKVGANTDGIGFLRALNSAKIPLCGNVLILGAGGAARVFAFEAAKKGCNITLMARKDNRVHNLKNEIRDKYSTPCESYFYDDLIKNYDFSKTDLLINASPAGMFPNIDVCPLPDDKLKHIPYLFDAVYNPRETLLSKKIRQNGGIAETGLSMLVNQAAEAQTLWRERIYTDDEINFVIEEILKNSSF